MHQVSQKGTIWESTVKKYKWSQRHGRFRDFDYKNSNLLNGVSLRSSHDFVNLSGLLLITTSW